MTMTHLIKPNFMAYNACAWHDIPPHTCKSWHIQKRVSKGSMGQMSQKVQEKLKLEGH